MKTILNDELISFLNESHNEYLAVTNIKEILLKNGFKELKENEKWILKENSSYFFSRNSNSLIAFKTPYKIHKDELYFKIVSTHLDSPSLKLKENPALIENGYEKWKVEVYGGLIYQSYVDRPLGIAGRVVYQKDNQILSKIVDSKKAIAIIPNVAIHQNRNINTDFKYNPQIDLLPLVALTNTKENVFDAFLKEISQESDIISYDLYFYNFDKAQYIGINDDLISGQKEDDLASAFISLKSLIETEDVSFSNSIKAASFFNNEETGSLSFSGADSDLLRNFINKIAFSYQLNEEEKNNAIKKSFVISADNGHAIHPYHPEMSDNKNICKLNEGILVKFNSNMAYTSDALTSAFIKTLLNKNNIPYQIFFNRSDVRGGSTLGNISISQVSMLTCDIGLPQLAMHSAYETLGTKDTESMFSLMKEFYKKEFKIEEGKITFLTHETRAIKSLWYPRFSIKKVTKKW